MEECKRRRKERAPGEYYSRRDGVEQRINRRGGKSKSIALKVVEKVTKKRLKLNLLKRDPLLKHRVILENQLRIS